METKVAILTFLFDFRPSVMLSKEDISRYNKVRVNTNKSILCHAPFVNINFEQNGNITACCFNRKHVLGTYPNSTINQAWTGEKAGELRKYILQNDLGGGCHGCQVLIESGSYYSSRSLPFDIYVAPETPVQKILHAFSSKTSSAKNIPAFPKSIELEISNTCNLECEMCDGYFSSSIRKNREKKPPLHNPYDDAFVDQLAQFLPHLHEIKFLGGEPFMIDIYYKIWDKILEINPGLRVNITTNGTIMNQRVRDLLRRLNCGVTVSLDALTADTYEKIRVRAKFNQVIDNVNEMMAILNSKGSALSIAICPMIHNWMELPDLVEFANKNNLHTYYNTVWQPDHASIASQRPKTIKQIIEFLRAHKFTPTTALHHLNISRYNDVIQTFTYWCNEWADGGELAFIYSKYPDFIQYLPTGGPEREITLLVIKDNMDFFGSAIDSDIAKLVETEINSRYPSNEPLKNSLKKIADNLTPIQYLLAHNAALIALAKIAYSQKIDVQAFNDKIDMLSQKMRSVTSYEEIIRKATSLSPIKQVLSIDRLSVTQLLDSID